MGQAQFWAAAVVGGAGNIADRSVVDLSRGSQTVIWEQQSRVVAGAKTVVRVGNAGPSQLEFQAARIAGVTIVKPKAEQFSSITNGKCTSQTVLGVALGNSPPVT